MHAHYETRPTHPNCGVVRVFENGSSFQTHDAWVFVCFIYITGDEVEIVGGCGAFNIHVWHAIHDLLVNKLNIKVAHLERHGRLRTIFKE